MRFSRKKIATPGLLEGEGLASLRVEVRFPAPSPAERPSRSEIPGTDLRDLHAPSEMSESPQNVALFSDRTHIAASEKTRERSPIRWSEVGEWEAFTFGRLDGFIASIGRFSKPCLQKQRHRWAPGWSWHGHLGCGERGSPCGRRNRQVRRYPSFLLGEGVTPAQPPHCPRETQTLKLGGLNSLESVRTFSTSPNMLKLHQQVLQLPP